MSNVDVFGNDFQQKTFLELNDLSKVILTDCNMNRNSAYFIGTVVSIIGKDSFVEIHNSNFYSNSGVTGGLFYIYSRSSISIYNSVLFSNFAVTAGVAYVNSDGMPLTLIIDIASFNIFNCTIFNNKAQTISVIEIVDSYVESTMVNTRMYANEIVPTAITISEIDDSSTCINL